MFREEAMVEARACHLGSQETRRSRFSELQRLRRITISGRIVSMGEML